MLHRMRKWARRKSFIVLLLALLLSLAWMSSIARADGRSYTREDAEIIARAIWGEARGCDATQQAAVVWCILNRVDNDAFPNSIQEVVTQPYQFTGYHAANPLDPGVLALVQDVLARWSIEQSCLAGVGRVLTSNYLFFSGNGHENIFREQYSSTSHWDWSIPSPYSEEVSENPDPNLTNTPAQKQRVWIPRQERLS